MYGIWRITAWAYTYTHMSYMLFPVVGGAYMSSFCASHPNGFHVLFSVCVCGGGGGGYT